MLTNRLTLRCYELFKDIAIAICSKKVKED
jgi:hypothetical protein